MMENSEDFLNSKTFRQKINSLNLKKMGFDNETSEQRQKVALKNSLVHKLACNRLKRINGTDKYEKATQQDLKDMHELMKNLNDFEKIQKQII